MKDVYQLVTDEIVKTLESGKIVWQMPWTNVNGDNAYKSHTNGKPYSFLNTLLLMSQGGEEGEYLTMQQANAEGGKIKQGAKAKFVVFSKRYTKEKTITNEQGEEEKVLTDRYVLRYYNVFHISDCEGITPKYEIKAEPTDTKQIDPIEECEQVMYDYNARETSLRIVAKETNNAYYSPSNDIINVPAMSQYKEPTEFYTTLFHEMVHSTGIETRCARGIENNTGHGSKNYSTEELVAEMGSAMILQRLGVQQDTTFKNSVAYIQGWLKALRNDKKMLFVASAQAEKAVKYIFNDK